MKEASEQTQAAQSLSELELANLKNSHEIKLAEREQRIKQIQEETSAAMDATRRTKEQINRVQNQRLKEVSSLRNQQQILQENLDVNKKKLNSSSEFVAVSGLYKKLKVSLDEMKVKL